ncbi:MAG: 2-C-methyl-D-erythritol 2,4-cyclodiphosphate synthase [Gammaproteobacteria bacterium]|uniref:2-C-methyl-D-erythritol 2,4-cyclodiphosphate synthase n=1 Tax=Candidatus Thiopontia autotrophica TaxID=2841688 RepID=A0A8J6PEH1_9GAMM|nr:2-C-methyl-D-erythritol 2,4-cyclodiphosphate synthase [Candidatus Thiopontia autotrophica]MBL6968903.1 2-C-methyl-D-erythritol 2,4-cyclodiphosphate synthase [Gammaproteobacteria bacterium]
MRIGHGFDVHAFEDGDHLMLCGIRVPYSRQFKAHSDGDVAIHALCDALLGAVALGDIGQLFPDSDDQYRGMDSRFFLREIMVMVGEKGYQIENIDLTIIAQEPRLAEYIQSMRQLLALDLGVGVDQVNVKATTTEQLGFVGERQGIAAHSVALLAAK